MGKTWTMSYIASLIAYAFVKRGMHEGRPVTQMKLQKMVYFAHGHHLAKFGSPLIAEDFEAWQFGPVVPNIYQEYKMFGRDPISIDKEDFDQQLRNLSKDAIESIDYTWNVTKGLSAATLSNWTHKKDSPWSKAYVHNGANIPMDNLEIEGYFKKLFQKVAEQQSFADANPKAGSNS